jgi:hypothetical protein
MRLRESRRDWVESGHRAKRLTGCASQRDGEGARATDCAHGLAPPLWQVGAVPDTMTLS